MRVPRRLTRVLARAKPVVPDRAWPILLALRSMPGDAALIGEPPFRSMQPRWRRRPRPREIRAVITPDGITLKKDGFSYGARWADASLVRESGSAYLMRFNQLYMRLPKRGFTPELDAFFREIALVALPRGANRLRA